VLYTSPTQTMEHAGHSLSQVRNWSSGSRSLTASGESSSTRANGQRKKSNSSLRYCAAKRRSVINTNCSPWSRPSARARALIASLGTTTPLLWSTSPLRRTLPPGNRSSQGEAPSSRRKRRFASATAAEHDAWKQYTVGAPSTLTRQAAEALARARGVDWVKRQEEQRADEWQARCEALDLARQAIQRWKENPKRCGTLEGIARLLDLASKLGRLASGMPTDRTEVTTEVQGKIDVEWEIAIKRVYGRPEPAPAEVVDVEARKVSDAGT